MTFALLLLASFSAGFIDAIAGGGGLIQLPALLLAYPDVKLPIVFGTNKCSSVFGTMAAIPMYARKVKFVPRFLWFSLPAAFVFSYLGAYSIATLEAQGSGNKFLKPLILMMLIAVATYTYKKKEFGNSGDADAPAKTSPAFAGGIGTGIGFYDGFFGPGTGSFIIYGLIRYAKFDFLTATAYAKAINFATNVGALAYFIPHGNVMFATALPMAACNILGGTLGARTAIKKGNRFVRVLFLTMIIGIIARVGYDIVKGIVAPVEPAAQTQKPSEPAQ